MRVFENRCSEKWLNPREVMYQKDRGKLHNEELLNLCCSPDTIKAVKWRRMKRVRHVSCIQGKAVHVAF